MIEEKVIEIIRLKEKDDGLKESVSHFHKLHINAIQDWRKNVEVINERMRALGVIIAPLRKNIVLEVDGITYCMHYNKNMEVAIINKAVTPKEADIALAVNKLQGVSNG